MINVQVRTTKSSLAPCLDLILALLFNHLTKAFIGEGDYGDRTRTTGAMNSGDANETKQPWVRRNTPSKTTAKLSQSNDV